MIWALGEATPRIHPSAYIHPAATVIGAVHIGADSSVWPGAVLRADYGTITIGERTAIQDNTVLHTTPEVDTTIGDNCLIGHLTHLEGCTIGHRTLVGSGAIVLNNVTISHDAIIAAGAVVTEHSAIPTQHIARGVPAKATPRTTTSNWINDGADQYVHMANHYRTRLRKLPDHP